MEVVRIDYKHINSCPSSAACIGYFDGLHLGHQALMKKTVELAKEKNIAAALITFDPDPWKIFFPDKKIAHLSTLHDRIQLAKEMNIDIFYILTFTKDFASLDIQAFHQVLSQMKIRSLVCGFDFQYGHKNSGNIESLKEQTLFDVTIIDSVNQDEQKISSSRIEPLIEKGDMFEANTLLSYVYSIQGHIVHGYKRGTNLLKIPTANLSSDPEYILPAVGVYSGMVSVDTRMFPAMINIGNNPTFENDLLTIEAHIIDFNEDIYDQEVRFYFLNKIRDEKKFPDFNALVSQLHQDIKTSKQDCIRYRSIVENTAKIWEKKLFIEV